MLISIIVPCYNYGHLLGEALESVLAQTLTNWECIIINDGSLDNTEETALGYCKKDDRFKYYQQSNRGHSAARNNGISKSSGKYILPLDADDRIAPNYIKAAVELMEADPSLKLVTSQVQLFGDSSEKFVMPPFDLRSYLMVNYICISSVFRRSDYDTTRGFDETMLAFEDWDLFIQLLKHGGKLQEVPFIGLFYRKKKNSVFENVKSQEAIVFKDLLKVYNNNIDVYQQYFSTPVKLIQENEKLNGLVKAYHNSNTFRFGQKLQKLKRLIFLHSNGR